MTKLRRNLAEENRERVRTLRGHLSGPEELLWNEIRRNRLGYRFRKQHPLGPYVLDFYCPEAKICLEVDGFQHEFTVDRDARRDRHLTQNGILTLRFPTDTIKIDMGHVRYLIKEACRSRIEAGLGRTVIRRRLKAEVPEPPPLPLPLLEGEGVSLSISSSLPSPLSAAEKQVDAPPPQGGGGVEEGVFQPEVRSIEGETP